MLSGKQERLPYSLSRWTDLPAAKWDWFQSQLDQGSMVGFDPRTAVPVQWSLAPEDVFGLVFWTKNPTNLIRNAAQLKKYPLVIHMTLTGWDEVEKGAPSVQEGLELMKEAANTFGAQNVTWRFSPIPDVPDVLQRFATMAHVVESIGVTEVYLAFLQENDLLPENRPGRVRRELLHQMAAATSLYLQLCNEDRTLVGEPPHYPHINLGYGICESGSRFRDVKRAPPTTEGCGCSLAVDPFTINETCTIGCGYCYAADKTLAPKKRNTTKTHLPVLP